MRKRICMWIAALAAVPVSTASAVNLLVYDNNPQHHFAAAAAAQIDSSGNVLATSATFNALLTGGTAWDCVLVDCPSTIPAGVPPAGGFGPLMAYVNGGGRCVMSFWDWDNVVTYPGLLAAFGATGTTTISLTDGVTSLTALAGGTALGLFNGVTMPNSSWHAHWGDDGDQFTLAAGSTGLAAIGGQPVIIRRGNGRAIAAFAIDEAGDTWVGNDSAIALWRNMVTATGAIGDVNCVCSAQYEVGDRVKALVANPSGASGLNIRTFGTVVCGAFGNPPIGIRWDNWHEGHAAAACDCPIGGVPGSDSCWFVECDEIAPIVECAKDINYDGAPGTAAPPSTLGPYNMTAFPANTPCPPATVTSVASPLGGTLDFSMSMEHRNVTGGPASACLGWATWSHGYTGDVYFTGGTIGAGAVTMTMPTGTGAIYFYVESNNFGLFDFVATSNGGTTSGTVTIDGSGGAKYFGFYAAGGSLTSVTLSNPAGDAGGWAVGEFGIARSGQVIFSGAPGTAAPPATLGPYVMNPFPLLACTGDVTSVPSPVGGSIGFSQSLTHRRIQGVLPCGFWATWSHGYTGDVYATPLVAASTTLTLTMPEDTGAVYLYVEPNSFGVFNFTVVSDNGTTSGTVGIDGNAGARYFGFYALGGGVIYSVTVNNPGGTANGFAVGEFGIAKARCGVTCLTDLNGDGIVNGLDLGLFLGQWTGPALYAPCPPRRPADFNGDCRVNGLDLAILLASWGPC